MTGQRKEYKVEGDRSSMKSEEQSEVHAEAVSMRMQSEVQCEDG